jgi:hypothetical protein
MSGEQVLKADAADDVLREALRQRADLVESVQAGAVSAHRAIMRAPFASVLGVAEFFDRFTQATNLRRAFPGAFPAQHKAAEDARIAQLRLAIDARDVLLAVLDDVGKISTTEALNLGRAAAMASGSPANAVQRVRAVMSAHPGLAALQARRDADLQRLAEAQQLQQDRQRTMADAQRAQDRMEAARVLLRRLARGGVSLSSSADGIAARPAGIMTAADIAEVKALRAEMVALLDAPAAMVA